MAQLLPMSRSKRTKVSSSTTAGDGTAGEQSWQDDGLLPGLPDHLAHLCLSSVHPSALFAVCRSWRRHLHSPSSTPYPALYAVLSGAGAIHLSCYNPITAKWATLPAPPLTRLLLTHHPSFLARSLPVQSASCRGCLILAAGTTSGLAPAISRPLVFDPSTSRWHPGPAFPSPRRWCALGSAGGALYVASGVGPEYSSELARSAERWDLNRAGSGWEPLCPMRDGRFSREPTEMVSSNGKLCMVNARGRGAKEGICFDVRLGRWDEMPIGLLTGWIGPAATVEDGGPIFVVDEASGILKKYEWEGDTWTAVMGSGVLKGAVGIAGGGGRLCITCGGGAAVAVVDVARGSVWTVLPPEGRTVCEVHVLPRMSVAES